MYPDLISIGGDDSFQNVCFCGDVKENVPTFFQGLNSLNSPCTGLVSRKQLAKLMGVSTETLKRAERRGELRPLKFNARLLRYKMEDIARWFSASSAGRPDNSDAGAALQAEAGSHSSEEHNSQFQ